MHDCSDVGIGTTSFATALCGINLEATALVGGGGSGGGGGQ